MSWSKNYTLASVAHRKLAQEAKRSEHVLRRLVAHANLLDSILEDLDHLAVGPRVEISSQCVGSQHCVQASRGSDVSDEIDNNHAEEDDTSEEDSDQDDCAGTDTDDDTCDILHTLRRSPPRYITDPLVRDFAHGPQRLSSDPASEVRPTDQVLSSEIEEQVACQLEVEDSEPIQRPSIDLLEAISTYASGSNTSSLFAMMTDRAFSAASVFDADASTFQEVDRSPTEFKSNFEEALMWQLATQSAA